MAPASRATHAQLQRYCSLRTFLNHQEKHDYLQLLRSKDGRVYPVRFMYCFLTLPSAESIVANQVSWQSAFWGLVPIALNSMTQPSGKVCDSPAGVGFLLRVSPFMCFFDALILLVRTVMYSFTKGSLPAAIEKIIVQRYTDDDEDAGELRGTMYTRWIVFALSASQIVKLFGFQGVLMTQICAAMFLGSFIVVELLVVIPRSYVFPGKLKAGDPVNGAGFDSLPYLTVTASTCFILFVIIQATVSVFEAFGISLDTLQSTGLTILFCGSGAFVPSGLYSHFLRLKEHVSSKTIADNSRPSANETTSVKPRISLRALENILLLLILAVPTAYYLLSYLLSPVRKGHLPMNPTTGNIVAPIMICIWAALSLLWAHSAFKAVIASGRATTRRVENVLSWYFWSLHLVAAVLYYKYVYNPKGTVKPGWTEQLG